MATLVTRDQWQAYMLTETSQSGDVYSLIGEGFTNFAESKNPKEYSRQYIHEKTERADVVGYAPSIAYSCDLHTGDACCERIAEITDTEAIGADALVDIVTVNLWEQVDTTTTVTYKAYKRKYSVIPDGKGDGTDAMIYTGTLKANGDIISGKFALETKTFTADT